MIDAGTIINLEQNQGIYMTKLCMGPDVSFFIINFGPGISFDIIAF